MNIFFKNQIHFLSLVIIFNTLALANENSIENLLEDMNINLDSVEVEYYLLKNKILSPTNDINTSYDNFLDDLKHIFVQLKNERIKFFTKIVDLEINQENITALSKLNSKALVLNNIIADLHNVYQNYNPIKQSKSYSIEKYHYNMKGLNNLEKTLDKL